MIATSGTTNEAVDRVNPDADEAFLGFLGAIYLEGLGQIAADSKLMHECFAAALPRLNADASLVGAFRRFSLEAATQRFDELDAALIEAEQYGLVQFPNPSYARVRIAMSRRDAERFVGDVGEAATALREAAREFKRAYLRKVW